MPQIYPQPVSSSTGVTITPQGFLSGGGFCPLNGQIFINGPAITMTPFSSALGAFTIAHGLGYSPTVAWCMGQGTGLIINFQYPLSWDNTNFYLWGSAVGMNGFVVAIQ